MSVFLRWGIFGILGVAGLMYAYNASKQLAAKRAAQPVPVAAQAATQAEATTQAAPASEEAVEVSPRCEEEFLVAQRAREARTRGEPLDRLLRIQEIAFKEPPRRARLEKVATFWFKLSSEPTPEDLRDSAIRNCQNFN